MGKRLSTATALLCFATPALGVEGTTYFVDGNGLLARCTAPNEQIIYCYGYISAATDAMHMLFPDVPVCTTPRVTVAQVVDIAINYLRDHPENRHLPAVFLVASALKPHFPCPAK